MGGRGYSTGGKVGGLEDPLSDTCRDYMSLGRRSAISAQLAIFRSEASKSPYTRLSALDDMLLQAMLTMSPFEALSSQTDAILSDGAEVER